MISYTKNRSSDLVTISIKLEITVIIKPINTKYTCAMVVDYVTFFRSENCHSCHSCHENCHE